MVRLSTGLRNAMLNGGTNGGLKGALALGFINIYSGVQPITADTAITDTLLGTVSIAGNGTGLTFGTTSTGTIAKTVSELWQFNGVVAGTAGYFRFYPAGGNPVAASTTEARIDGSIAATGADMNLTNPSIIVSAPNTVDVFQFTLPAQ